MFSVKLQNLSRRRTNNCSHLSNEQIYISWVIVRFTQRLVYTGDLSEEFSISFLLRRKAENIDLDGVLDHFVASAYVHVTINMIVL